MKIAKITLDEYQGTTTTMVVKSASDIAYPNSIQVFSGSIEITGSLDFDTKLELCDMMNGAV